MSFVLGAVGAAFACLLLALWRIPYERAKFRHEFEEQATKTAQVAAKEQLFRQREAFENSLLATQTQLREIENRCRLREDAVDRRMDALEDRERELAQRERTLDAARIEVAGQEAEVERLMQRELRDLEKVSGMRREEAEHRLLDRIEKSFQAEKAEVLARAEESLQEDLGRRARDVLLTAMERLASAQAAEALVTTVQVDDELKALLVGREGRNARCFEAQTGVDLLIDDTPGVVVLSAFEPVRREIARRALERLLDDGRIQPQRIEEVVAETRQEMEDVVTQLGGAAADEAGVTEVHARLLTLLGRLEFKTSEGQNVRRHAIETALLAGALATELGLEPDVARRCGLLCNVGKAVDHSVEGGHAKVGADFARRCNEDPRVVNAIAAHHGKEAPTSPYAVLTEVASVLSSRRPGARDGRVEHAIRRREAIEAVAAKHPGVLRSYAIQAGRELRVIVDPVNVSDKGAAKLAREIAKAIEATAPGPGEVRVTVIRELRHEETAA